MRLSTVLSPADLPWQELQAARLDGELYAVDQCFSPVDELPGIRQRSLALSVVVPPRLIVELHSAAWIWGAIAQPPGRHRLCSDIAARSRPPIGSAIQREVVVDSADVVRFDCGLSVTTPVRTAVDIARLADYEWPSDAVTITGLMTAGGFGVDDCVAQMERRRNLPDKRRALHRLREAAEFAVERATIVDGPLC